MEKRFELVVIDKMGTMETYHADSRGLFNEFRDFFSSSGPGRIRRDNGWIVFDSIPGEFEYLVFVRSINS